LFFFSSRRRHTRFSRDWSSDVCSSDLIAPMDAWMGGIGEDDVIGIAGAYKMRKSTLKRNIVLKVAEDGGSAAVCMLESNATMVKIGRASCRERVEMWVVARSWAEKHGK